MIPKVSFSEWLLRWFVYARDKQSICGTMFQEGLVGIEKMMRKKKKKK